MSMKYTPIAAAVAMVLSSAAASAFEINLRGYGTAAVAHSSEDQADVVNMAFVQPEGVGYTDEWSAALDSKLGLQLDMRFTDKLSAVFQVVSQDTYGNSWDGKTVVDDFTPSLEWANLSYRATDNLTIRAGRVVLPFLLLSDSQRVGYANHWLRAPAEVYGELPFFTSDGGDVAYKSNFGSTINTLRAHYGVQKQVREEANNNVTLWGVNDTIEVGGLLVRAAYLNVEFESTSDQLTNLFQGAQFFSTLVGETEAAAAAARLEDIYDVAQTQKVELINFGVSYDANDWFVMSEVNKVMSDGVQIGGLGGYISGGIRRGAFTPYVTVSRAKSDKRDEQFIPTESMEARLNAPPPVGLPPSQIDAYYQALGAAYGLSGAVNYIVGGFIANNGQTTTAVGVRWDVARNIAVKTQFDHIDLDEGSSGRLTNVQPEFEYGGKVNVFSLSVDFVF